jgi:hypothetical protein
MNPPTVGEAHKLTVYRPFLIHSFVPNGICAGRIPPAALACPVGRVVACPVTPGTTAAAVPGVTGRRCQLTRRG